jgi:hypothetical protein
MTDEKTTIAPLETTAVGIDPPTIAPTPPPGVERRRSSVKQIFGGVGRAFAKSNASKNPEPTPGAVEYTIFSVKTMSERVYNEILKLNAKDVDSPKILGHSSAVLDSPSAGVPAKEFKQDIMDILFPYRDLKDAYNYNDIIGLVKTWFRLDFSAEQITEMLKHVQQKEVLDAEHIAYQTVRRLCNVLEQVLTSSIEELVAPRVKDEDNEKEDPNIIEVKRLEKMKFHILLGLCTNPNLMDPHLMTLEKSGMYQRLYNRISTYTETEPYELVINKSGLREFLEKGFPITCTEDLKEMGLSEKFSTDDHQHPLELSPNPYPSGTFGCNGCDLIGSSWAYHCADCNYDLHVHCAVKKEYELFSVIIAAMNLFDPRPEGEIRIYHEDFSRILRYLALHHEKFEISEQDVQTISQRFSAFSMGTNQGTSKSTSSTQDVLEAFALVLWSPAYLLWKAIQICRGIDTFSFEWELAVIFTIMASVQSLIYSSVVLYWVGRYKYAWDDSITATEAHLPLILLLILPFFVITLVLDEQFKQQNPSGKSFDVQQIRLESETVITLRTNNWRTSKKNGMSLYRESIQYLGSADGYMVICSILLSLLVAFTPLIIRASVKAPLVGSNVYERIVAITFIVAGLGPLISFFCVVSAETGVSLFSLNRELDRFEQLTAQGREISKTGGTTEIPIMVLTTVEDLKGWNCLRDYMVTYYTKDISSIETNIGSILFAILIVLSALYAAKQDVFHTSFTEIMLLRILAVILIISICGLLFLAAKANSRLDDHVSFLKKLLHFLNEVNFCGDPDTKQKVFTGYELFITGMIGVLESEVDFKIFGLKISLSLLQSLASVGLPVAYNLIKNGYF